MDLNTVTAIRRPRSADEVDAWRPGDAWLAGGTWLFSEPQPGTDTLIDLAGLGWAPDRGKGGGHHDRRDLPHRGDRAFPLAGSGMARGAAVPRLLQFVPRLVQDLERGDDRRQHLHVPARRPDDLAHRRA